MKSLLFFAVLDVATIFSCSPHGVAHQTSDALEPISISYEGEVQNNVAKKAFSDFLDGKRMNSRQIYFVNQIVEYIVHNGMMTDFAVLQESPFTDQGSVVDIFDDTSVWMSIRNVIEQINYNAVI